MYLKSNCKPLDDLLGGGIEKGTITEFYGEGGSGKTNICLQLAGQCVKEGKKVIFIDTEGLSPVRMKQVFGDELENILGEMLVFKPYSLMEQVNSLQKAKRLVDNLNVGLVIMDTVSLFYRKYYSDDSKVSKKGWSLLAQMMIDGLSMARRSNTPLLLTNQVYTDVEHNRLRPVGGHIINHNAKAIVELQRLADGLRKAVVIKHRSIRSQSHAYFRIVGDGLAEADIDLVSLGSWAEEADE